MKRVLLISSLLLMVAAPNFAQEDKSKRPSPPAVAEGTIDGVKVKIDYSTPSAKGRKMLGGIEPYGTVWRTGANETTTIEFSGPVQIEGKELAKGKYALFTIPGETDWTIIFNKTIKWGAFSYKQDEDVLRVNVKSSKAAAFQEKFLIEVKKNHVVLKWENTEVAFGVKGAK
jgi:Protein of unknown function (DUF2911)